MRITRKVDRDGTLGPVALNYLGGLPEKSLFFVGQRLRHPASLYSLSLEKLLAAFDSVVDKFESDSARYGSVATNALSLVELLTAQEGLLRCLQEHLADCYLILRCLVDPAGTQSRAIDAAQYVLDAKLPGAKAFAQASEGYKASLKIANRLKHNQGRLRGVGVDWGQGLSLGYFLEEPDSDGDLGPSSEIHPDRGAFSFARDLNWRFFLVYALSENLVRAVERALIGLHQTRIERMKARDQHVEGWCRLVQRISEVPLKIFPKEAQGSIARVQISADRKELSMKFPDRPRLTFDRRTPRAIVSTRVDEFSTRFNRVLQNSVFGTVIAV